MIKSKSARWTVAASVLAAMTMGAGLLGPAALGQTPKPIAVSPPAGAPMSFADLIDRVSPAVVSVIVTTEIKREELDKRFNPFRGLPGFDDEDGGRNQPQGDGQNGDDENQETDEEGNALGSGFFISSSGYIVTNNHVVEDAREVSVVLKGGDELEAEIVGTDEQTDLAVLKVKKSGNYPYVQFATKAKPRVGDWVIAVGNPFGLGGTATAGIVSADARTLNGSGYNDFIQVDAPINKGNSGGPTFNLNGEVIGVNTAIFSNIGGGSVGIGFAIEAGAAKKITDTLIKDGKVTRGWLGVEIQNLDPRFAEAYGLKDQKGAIVSLVTKGGPAEVSGIKREDIIIAVNGEKVESNRELTQRVGSLIAGSRNSFKIIRRGKEETVWVVVKARDPNLGKPESTPVRGEGVTKPKSEPGDVKLLGGSVRPLTTTEMAKFEKSGDMSGLLVVTVERKGALAEAAISVGDALLAVNNKPIKAVKDLEDAVAEAKAGGKEHIAVLVGCADQSVCTTLLHPVKVN
jgi:serine protease Do